MTIHKELEAAWGKAEKCGGKLEILKPDSLSPKEASEELLTLLQSAYTNHAISKRPKELEDDIKSQKVRPWFVTRDNLTVACAALVRQDNGDVELGRAVSIENGTGVGKIAMLTAAMHKGTSTLVAEVRLAHEFAGVPGSEATQRICLDLLRLVPHALLFAFNHGTPLRREMFAFSSENVITIRNSPLLTAQNVLSGRCIGSPPRRLKQVQDTPFRVIAVDDSGISHQDMSSRCRSRGSGFTLAQIEATDDNLGTISALISNDFVLVGQDRSLGSSGLPVIWLATVARGEILAPTSPSSVLPRELQDDIRSIDTKFRKLAGDN